MKRKSLDSEIDTLIRESAELGVSKAMYVRAMLCASEILFLWMTSLPVFLAMHFEVWPETKNGIFEYYGILWFVQFGFEVFHRGLHVEKRLRGEK